MKVLYSIFGIFGYFLWYWRRRIRFIEKVVSAK